MLKLLILLISVDMFTAFFKGCPEAALKKNIAVCTNSLHMQMQADAEAAPGTLEAPHACASLVAEYSDSV